MKDLIRKILKEQIINNGELTTQTLYHGTKFGFDKFDLNFFNRGSGDGGWLGYGIYLTNDYEYAESYGKVLECKINIKNPYIISEYSYSRSPEKLANELGVKNAREITTKLIKGGYDSVILTYPDKGYTKDGEYNEFIEICIFNPNDIQIINNLNEQHISLHKSELFDLEYDILKNIPDGYLYHGSNNISYFNDTSSIDTSTNTVNAKSKYLFLTPNKRTAFNYSKINNGMDIKISDKSGVLSFALKKSKGKKLTSNELKYNNMVEFEQILDSYKNKGYDYVIIVPDGKNYVILNPNILKLVDKTYTYDAINKQNIDESLNLDNCEELYNGTFLCKGTYETYHLSTSSNLEVGKKMNHKENTKNTVRGGDGDYIYSSLEPKKWLDVLSQETNEVPNYLYKVIIKNPKYKKSFNLFGKTTPSQFLSDPNNTIVKEFIGNIKDLYSLKEGEVVYHGSPNDFSEFKLKKGTMFTTNDMSPIFLSTDKDNFAKYYAKENGCVYTIELNDNINLFDFRKMVDWWELSPNDYGYKLYNDMNSGEYDLTPYNDDVDKLYDYIQSGEYSILERPWFYKWLKDNNYDGAYVVETNTLNLFVFNPNKIKIINKDCNLNESKIRGFIRKILRESLLKESSEHTIKSEEDFIPVQIDDDISDVIMDLKRIKMKDKTFNFMRLNGIDKNKFVIETDDEGEIGSASLNCYDKNFDGCYLDNIRINPKYRRIGLASKMYDYIEGLIGEKLKPSPIKQSPEIKIFWRNKS